MEKTCQKSSLTEVLDTPPEMGEANGNGTDEDGSFSEHCVRYHTKPST